MSHRPVSSSPSAHSSPSPTVAPLESFPTQPLLPFACSCLAWSIISCVLLLTRTPPTLLRLLLLLFLSYSLRHLFISFVSPYLSPLAGSTPALLSIVLRRENSSGCVRIPSLNRTLTEQKPRVQQIYPSIKWIAVILPNSAAGSGNRKPFSCTPSDYFTCDIKHLPRWPSKLRYIDKPLFVQC